ncbi:MAG: hypothetical protein Q9219_003338 [cf. Caloplaca sp. 3 TL-2023]
MSRIQQDLNGHHSKQDSSLTNDSQAMLRRIIPQGRRLNVCVVGAGVAGMRCAQVLGENDVNVTVLEARDRTGGRVRESWLQTGPNWIHGVINNPILDLAHEVKATTLPAPELPPSVYDPSGQLLSPKESQECSELMWGIIEEAFEYSNKNSASIPQDQSLLDFFKLKLKEKHVPQKTQERLLQVCRSWGDYVGGSIERQSLKYFWLEETVDGASTYKSILELITKDTYAHADVQLSTKVASIISQASSGDQNTSSFTSVAVTTDRNQTTEYDEVVTTVPLGYLKRNKDTFDPPLPTRIQTAITNLSYGRLEKVYLTFPSAFWLLPTKDPESTLNPFFNQWLAPDYTPNPWPVECVFLSSLPSPCAQPTLLFYMHGPLAEHITTLTSPLGPSTPEYLTALTSVFQPYYARLPNYSPTDPACAPTHALATDWTHDELAGCGSYSNFQVSDPKAAAGKVELDRDIEALREGCVDRRVWFAGEHTAPFVALGTVTGAWWSGEKVAKRILEVYGIGGSDGADENEGVEGGRVGGKRGGTGLGG